MMPASGDRDGRITLVLVPSNSNSNNSQLSIYPSRCHKPPFFAVVTAGRTGMGVAWPVCVWRTAGLCAVPHAAFSSSSSSSRGGPSVMVKATESRTAAANFRRVQKQASDVARARVLVGEPRSSALLFGAKFPGRTKSCLITARTCGENVWLGTALWSFLRFRNT